MNGIEPGLCLLILTLFQHRISYLSLLRLQDMVEIPVDRGSED